MNRYIRLPLIITTLLLSWALMIWMQWNHHLETSINLVGMPLMMLAMALLAALAAQGKDDQSE